MIKNYSKEIYNGYKYGINQVFAVGTLFGKNYIDVVKSIEIIGENYLWVGENRTVVPTYKLIISREYKKRNTPDDSQSVS